MLRSGIIVAASLFGVAAVSGTASAQHGYYGHHHHHGYTPGYGGYAVPYGFGYAAPAYSVPAYAAPGVVYPSAGLGVGGFYSGVGGFVGPGYGYGVPYRPYYHHHHHGHHW